VPRYRLLVEYDGTPFAGWQRQADRPSVQAALEDAAAALTGAQVTVIGAGRTDAGVHASGQVAHLDLPRPFVPERLLGGLNAHLRPWPIAVIEARPAAGGFHARFGAIRRRYRYRILNRRAPPALERAWVWHVPVPLDLALMAEAARRLEGRHDFSSFRAAECQAASPVRTLERLCVQRHGAELWIEAAARSFLHHQVRNIVGTLERIGAGRLPLAGLRAILEARDRAAAGPTAPAAGLILMGVDYPAEPPAAPGR
jgi:tRNA pseudouridine38-40 synthase